MRRADISGARRERPADHSGRADTLLVHAGLDGHSAHMSQVESCRYRNLGFRFIFCQFERSLVSRLK